MSGRTGPPSRRSAVPWLYGLAAALALLSPILFVAVWASDGTLDGLVPAFLAALVDLAAAVVAAVVATVLAARRGITRVRTVVSGHPQGRAGRMAEYQAARWSVARERFAALQREYAAFEADPTAVAARPALTDVTVPATARFVEAYGDAQFLLTDTEPSGPRREEFAGAVDRAVASWHEAQRTADALAGVHSPGSDAGAAGTETVAVGPGADGSSRAGDPESGRAALGPARPGAQGAGQEYADVADAVRKAAARGMKDLRDRMRA